MTSEKKGSKHHKIFAPRTRREFVRDLGITATAAAGFTVLGLVSHSDEPMHRVAREVAKLKKFRVRLPEARPQLAVVHGVHVESMVREALALLGGIQHFIARGDKVLIKPNVGWDRQPEQAANTNPEVVAAVVRLCRDAGAGEVWVTDVSLNNPQRCFFRSGIEAAAREAGAAVLLPSGNDFVDTDMGGDLLKIWPVARYYHEADKVINLPVVKHHSLCGGTLAMKNWYGVLGGRRNQLHQRIHTSIVDLANALRPTFTLLDATRVLKRNGPTGGSLDDVVVENTIIAGLDEVAIDAYGLKYLGLKPDQAPYLALGEKRGLGVVNWRGLRMEERQLG